MPNSSSALAAASMTGQSESDPMTMPTTGSFIWVIHLGSLTLVSQLPGEPRRRVPRTLQSVVQVLTVGVHVPDLAARPQVLTVEVHAEVRVARHRVAEAVVEPAG